MKLAADGDTLFLDKIGDMSLKTRAKVLRCIEEQSLQPMIFHFPTEAGPAGASTLHEARAQYEREFIVSKAKFRPPDLAR